MLWSECEEDLDGGADGNNTFQVIITCRNTLPQMCLDVMSRHSRLKRELNETLRTTLTQRWKLSSYGIKAWCMQLAEYEELMVRNKLERYIE